QYFEVLKRDGTSQFVNTPGPIVSGFYWEYFNQYIVVIDKTVYSYDTRVGTLLWSHTMTTGTIYQRGWVGFTTFQYNDGSMRLVVISNDSYYLYTNLGAATQITPPG